MRYNLYKMIKPRSENTRVGKIYDIVMIVVILASLLPLMFKNTTGALVHIDKITVTIFILDYLLRWVTADYHFNQKGIIPFIKYPFSIMAILDILTILPSLAIIPQGFKAIRLLRLVRVLKVFKVWRAFRYSRNIEIIMRVFKQQKNSLVAVVFLAGGYVFVSALIIFQVEPSAFDTFFDAIYWATISLTTVGYGDVFAISVAGRIITMLSAFIGIAIVALPAGIITAGYMNEINKNANNE